MKNVERCRGIISRSGPQKGKRCKFKALKGGFCGFHQNYIRPRKSKIADSTPNGVIADTGRKVRVTAEANGCVLVVEGSPFQVRVIMQRVLG